MTNKNSRTPPNYETINLGQIDAFIRLVELQRDLSYHMSKFLDAQKRQNEEFNILLSKAQSLAQLKSNFRQVAPELKHTLTDEQRKKINNMLHQRHINLKI